MNRSKLKNAYWSHMQHARERGIAWDFTYAMWELRWVLSGKLHLRGAAPGLYCMSRYGDTGPYSWNNTFIQLWTDNTKEGRTGRKHTKKSLQQMIDAKRPKMRAVEINGVQYESISAASKATGESVGKIGYRIDSPNHPTWVSV